MKPKIEFISQILSKVALDHEYHRSSLDNLESQWFMSRRSGQSMRLTPAGFAAAIEADLPRYMIKVHSEEFNRRDASNIVFLTDLGKYITSAFYLYQSGLSLVDLLSNAGSQRARVYTVAAKIAEYQNLSELVVFDEQLASLIALCGGLHEFLNSRRRLSATDVYK